MKKLLPVITALLFLVSCKKESAVFTPTPVSDYAPLTVGQYVTYNCDSLVFTNLGTTQEDHLYQVKYETTDTLTDLLGRPAFRITRYIRSLPGGTFTPDNTFVGVNTNTGFELTENNLRYLKLAAPVQEGFTWKGNSAIDVSSLGSDLQYLYDWDYTYADVNQTKQIGTFSVDSTVTVNEHNDSLNLPIIFPGSGVADPTNIATKDFSQEIYAKHIGLVYRNFIHYEYQLAFHGFIGYGITLTLADHN